MFLSHWQWFTREQEVDNSGDNILQGLKRQIKDKTEITVLLVKQTEAQITYDRLYAWVNILLDFMFQSYNWIR